MSSWELKIELPERGQRIGVYKSYASAHAAAIQSLPIEVSRHIIKRVILERIEPETRSTSEHDDTRRT